MLTNPNPRDSIQEAEIVLMHPISDETCCPRCHTEHVVGLTAEIVTCTCGTNLVILFSESLCALVC